MRSLIAAAVLLTASAAAQGATPDCTRVQVSNRQPVITYKTKAVFPTPSEFVNLKLAQEPASVCGLIGRMVDDTSWEVTGQDKSALWAALDVRNGGYENTFDLELFGVEVPGARSQIMQLRVNMNRGELSVLNNGEGDPDMMMLLMFPKNVVGVKVNGGAMQPLVFDGKTQVVKFSPKDLQSLDFYNIVDRTGIREMGFGLERLLLNVAQPSITFWKTYPFPK